MFHDVGVSKTLMDHYRTYCEKKTLNETSMINWGIICFQIFVLVDFSVMVLSSNSWPFSAPLDFVLPDEVKFSCLFFNYKHSIFSFSLNEHLIVLPIFIHNNTMDAN